jgi:hypothetical protein
MPEGLAVLRLLKRSRVIWWKLFLEQDNLFRPAQGWIEGHPEPGLKREAKVEARKSGQADEGV